MMLPVVTLPLDSVTVLADDDLFGVAARFLEFAFQPDQCLAGILRTVAQAIEQLRRKGRVAGMGSIGPQQREAVILLLYQLQHRSATSLAIWRMSRERLTRTARRRRFSTSTKRSSDGSAHSSPICSGSTDW